MSLNVTVACPNRPSPKSSSAERGRVLTHGKRRHDERRVVVDGVLLVGLREEEHARLPAQLGRVRQSHRSGLRRRETDLLRELKILLRVVARQNRARRVVEVGHVLGLPIQESRGAREHHRAARAPRQDRRADHIPIGAALEVARGVERIAAKRPHVVERVVAVASPLAGEDHAPLPGAVRQPEQLRLSRERRAGIDVVAGDVVDREAIAVHLRERHAEAELVGRDRTRDAAADRPRAVVAERHGERARPVRHRRPRARDVHQPAQRVAAEQRALRTADELDLIRRRAARCSTSWRSAAARRRCRW